MYDGKKIIPGLGIFLVVALFPVWNDLLRPPGPPPQPKLPTAEKQCVLPTATMRATHMELLNAWRNEVVREGVRTTKDAAGKTITMSLTGTCMSCHPNKKEFCDSCHNYMAVSPYCWECHVEPKGGRT